MDMNEFRLESLSQRHNDLSVDEGGGFVLIIHYFLREWSTFSHCSRREAVQKISLLIMPISWFYSSAIGKFF